MYLWFYLLHRTVWQLVFSHSGNGARLSHNHVNTNLNWVDLPYGNLWHCMYESWATDCWQCWLRNWNQNCWPAHGLMHVRLEGCQYSHSIQLNTKKVQSPADKATTSTANSWPSFAVLSMMCLVASKTIVHTRATIELSSGSRDSGHIASKSEVWHQKLAWKSSYIAETPVGTLVDTS